MEAKMNFGNSLESLLDILDISMVRLAKAINVDSSLVNRWVNNKRIPSYRSDYIEKISEYLSGCVCNSYQSSKIDDVYEMVFDRTVQDMNTKDKINHILLETQGFSYESKRLNNKIELKIIDSKSDSLKSAVIKKSDLTLHDHLSQDGSLNFTSRDRILIGSENIYKTCFEMLTIAINSKPTMINNHLYIAFSNSFYTANYSNYLINCRNVIMKAIENGWQVMFLVDLKMEFPSLTKFIDFSLPLINTGRFHPYYYKKYEALSNYDTLIVVPKVGAIMGVTDGLGEDSHCAFSFENKKALQVLENKFNIIIMSLTNSLINFMNNGTSMYFDVLTSGEAFIGNRILYKREFGVLILPYELYKKLLYKLSENTEETYASLEYYERRFAAFQENITYYKYYDIYHIDCINRIIKYKKLYLYLYNRIIEISLTDDEAVQILENIISLLILYPNFHVAFLNENSALTFLASTFSCVVKEKKVVMIETFKDKMNGPEVRYSIDEPILVNAMDTYFTSLMDQIAPMNKDRNEIIDWLLQGINALKSNCL